MRVSLSIGNKKQAFDASVKRKLDAKDFNFEGIWFPDAIRFAEIAMNETGDFIFAVFNDYVSFSKIVFKER